ncbi:unnamed protein product [Polarella glacialis]|uniref:EF-hand domain-containing protein n=1 Tax=Polarella glacialis TaxID=89957 RepID=A0A813D7S1_POLGL|nr:unnamed protein product [Polarella glacialis]
MTESQGTQNMGSPQSDRSGSKSRSAFSMKQFIESGHPEELDIPSSPQSIRSGNDNMGPSQSDRSGSKLRNSFSMKLDSKFIKSEHPEEPEIASPYSVEGVRNLLKKALQSQAADGAMAVVILFDVYLSCYDIDASASNAPIPAWVDRGSTTCFCIYFLELVLNLFVKRCKVVGDEWIALDCVVVGAGLTDMFVQAIDGGTTGSMTGALSLVRLLRVFRILRLTRLFRKIKELRKLILMSASCVRTLCWSFVFCFMVMSFWSMAAVELVHPLVQTMADQGEWSDCPQCTDSLSSVMVANLFFFKTIIAGDGWGLVAVPVIRAHPWTAFIFLGANLTIVFGVLNMVVAVVVDEFAEKRLKDVAGKAEEMQMETETDKKFLKKLFTRIDEDDSGEVDLEELLNGARRIPEFRQRLRVMDIDEADLRQMFDMLDGDGSGTIDSSEFIGALSRWLHDSKTAARFIKYNVMQALQQQEKLSDLVSDKLGRVEMQLAQFASQGAESRQNSKASAAASAEAASTNDSSDGITTDSSQCLLIDPSIYLQPASQPCTYGAAKDALLESVRAALKKAEQALEESLQTSLFALQQSVLSSVVEASEPALHRPTPAFKDSARWAPARSEANNNNASSLGTSSKRHDLSPNQPEVLEAPKKEGNREQFEGRVHKSVMPSPRKWLQFEACEHAHLDPTDPTDPVSDRQRTFPESTLV